MYCLDTNIIIDIFRNEGGIAEKVNSLLNSNDFFITSITLCELYKGAFGHANSEEKLKKLDEFLDNVQLITLNKDSSKEFGKLWQKLKENGKLINYFDVLIASIVKAENLTLITRDKDFKDLGIKVVII
jgi:tRNA(fMet)-specific endonuclease VapC